MVLFTSGLWLCNRHWSAMTCSDGRACTGIHLWAVVDCEVDPHCTHLHRVWSVGLCWNSGSRQTRWMLVLGSSVSVWCLYGVSQVQVCGAAFAFFYKWLELKMYKPCPDSKLGSVNSTVTHCAARVRLHCSGYGWSTHVAYMMAQLLPACPHKHTFIKCVTAPSASTISRSMLHMPL